MEKNSQYQAIALKNGYVESNSTSWLIYQTTYTEPFKSKKEAIISLATYLFFKHQIDSGKQNISFDSWCFFISKIFKLNNDSYGYHTHEEAIEKCGADWDYCSFIFNISIDEIIVIPERAENILFYALSIGNPDLFSSFGELDEDDISGPNNMDKIEFEKLIK